METKSVDIRLGISLVLSLEEIDLPSIYLIERAHIRILSILTSSKTH